MASYQPKGEAVDPPFVERRAVVVVEVKGNLLVVAEQALLDQRIVAPPAGGGYLAGLALPIERPVEYAPLRVVASA
jgi:hypothetical protein